MTEVYGATDARLERSVPIKVLPTHPSDYANVKQRFGRNLTAISRLQNISKTGEDSRGLEGTPGEKKRRGNSITLLQ